MYFNSLDFKAMESSLNALSVQQQVITHNIANVDTPDYKAYEFSFENAMEDAMQNLGTQDGRETYSNSSVYDFRGCITQDTSTENLVDGNNVDVEEESLKLYGTYVQHAAIINKFNSRIADFKYVLTQASFK